MLFDAISEEKTRGLGSLSFYCRNYRVKRKEKRGFFCRKLWKILNVQGKKYSISVRQNNV